MHNKYHRKLHALVRDRLRSWRPDIWALKVLELQLVITTLSLPLVLVRGLPLSLIAVAGNVIFTPFLFFFLLLSSLIFISQLLYIPNAALIYLLEHLRKIWLACMAHVDQHVMLELPAPSLPIAAVFFALACGLICYRIERAFIRCSLLFSLLILGCTGLHFFARPAHAHLVFRHGKGTLHFFSNKNKLVCVDDGVSATGGLKSSILYTVLPTVRKECGSTALSALIFLKPTRASQTVAQLLVNGSNTQAQAYTVILPALNLLAQRDQQPKIADTCKELEKWAHVNCKNVIALDTNLRPFILGPVEIRAESTSQRTKYFSHALLKVYGICGQEKIVLMPVGTKYKLSAQPCITKK